MKCMNYYLTLIIFLTTNFSFSQSFTYTSPKDNSSLVSLSTNIILKSDENIDPVSLLHDKFSVIGSVSGLHTGNVKLSDDNKTILFIPNTRFASNEEVKVFVYGGIKNINGNVLPPVTLHFKTSPLSQRIKIKLSDIMNNGNSYKPSLANQISKSNIKNTITKTVTSGLPQITVNSSNNPADGKVFLANFSLTSSLNPNDSVTNYLMILNNDGSVAKYNKIDELGVDFKIQPDGQPSYSDITASYGGYYEAGRIFVTDTSLTPIDTFQCGNGYVTFPADFRLLPNGHSLAFAMDPEPVDMTQYGGSPDANAVGVVIQELDASKNVVFQWRTWDYLPVTDSYVDITGQTVDLIHANAIDVDNSGNIVFSMRHLSSVIKIDRQTGNIIWTLGGKQNQFTFINEHESNSPNYFSFQHDVRVLPNGNITLFDNGNQHQPNYSRGVEYKLDEQNKTATLVWEFRHTPDIYGFAMGSVQRLPNGNTLIGWGLGSLSGAPMLTEVHPDQSVALEFSLPVGQASFRVYKLPWISDVTAANVDLEVAQGNTYNFNSPNDTTGVTIKYDLLNSSLYAFTTVTSYNYSPLNPAFNATPPLMVSNYINIKGLGITSYTGEVHINLINYPLIINPNLTIVYARPVGGNTFTPVATSYDPTKNQLNFTTSNFGDFAFGIPQSVDSVYTPAPLSPGDSEIVNGLASVKLLWGTRGIVQSYHLQVSNNPAFSSTVVDNSGLTSTFFILSQLNNNSTYYWRLSNTNTAGTSNWSNIRSFNTASPFIKVLYPNGGQVIFLDSTYVVRWQSNINDTLNISLLRANNSVTSIGDSVFSGTNEYKWKVPSNLQQDSTYKIMVSSISNTGLSGISSSAFSILSNITGVKSTNNIVKSYVLSQNYPNPFNPSTVIQYSIPQESVVRIDVYNVIGERITTLVNEMKKSGNYEISWNASNISSGVYFYSIKATGNNGQNFAAIKKMILLK
ncbi:MAG: aryl-sulfate sulfotransferase [Ignavibacteriaceae bacterium]|nr:aryl-sulfate sulfotransferase [Ignavibacteriaceae bacterium]